MICACQVGDVFIRKADDANEGIFGVMARYNRRLFQVDREVREWLQHGVCALDRPPHSVPRRRLQAPLTPLMSFLVCVGGCYGQLWQHLKTIEVFPEYYSFRWLTTLLSR